jgi:hypothetical protein
MFDEIQTASGTGADHSAQNPTTRRLELLSLSRLSRRPASVVCGNCQKPVARDFEFGLAVGICRRCLEIYARIDSILNAAGEAKARAARLIQFADKAKV